MNMRCRRRGWRERKPNGLSFMCRQPCWATTCCERENKAKTPNDCLWAKIDKLVYMECLTFLECTRAVILLHHIPEEKKRKKRDGKNRTNWFLEASKRKHNTARFSLSSFLHISCPNKLYCKNEQLRSLLSRLSEINVKGQRTR